MTKKPMETLHDLIEEAKLRTLWWALFIFAVSYFLTHTSKSMWMNIPMSVLFACALRVLLNEVDFRWKVRMSWPKTYLSHLERKQLSENDPRLSTTPDPPRWKNKIDSQVVEAAVSDFVDKILKDFVVDLWLSEITPDMETAEHIRTIIMDAIGEVAGRAIQLNLVDLLTKDVVDLIGDHIELFRRNQAVIGVDVMKTLSSEERDERLKHHLMASKELHPALLSPESEHKVLQRLMGGVVATVLKPQEAQIPIVRSIAREILSCLVMQPVMNLASPGYINELIETLLLTINEESSGLGKVTASCGAPAASKTGENSSAKGNLSFGRESELPLAKMNRAGTQSYQITPTNESLKTKPADWALMLEVATKRRTEVLTPENLENMWAKGRNYKKKENKYFQKPLPVPDPIVKGSSQDSLTEGNLRKGMSTNRLEKTLIKEKNFPFVSAEESTFSGRLSDENSNRSEWKLDSNMGQFLEGEHAVGDLDGAKNGTHYKNRLKRSNSTSDLSIQSRKDEMPIISNFYSPEFERYGERLSGESSSDIVIKKEVQQVPNLRCRVMGAYFEKLGSKSFAVYSIAVTAAENRTWFVKRRYSNFERLHRQLKDIPNYMLHLPPKRIFSSSTEDAFVHQRCIQLDKYLQDLLSIANVAEQHEVWDFLSSSSKNYSFGKSSSVMRTLAVNVDDAVDDIMRQVKGVSGGLMRKVAGSTSPGSEGSVYSSTLVCNASEEDKSISRQMTADTNTFSDEGSEKDMNRVNEEIDGSQPIGWHSDNEVNLTSVPNRVMKLGTGHKSSGNIVEVDTKSNQSDPPENFTLCFGPEDPTGMPPEWSPPKLSVPVLNLVDNVFQLKRRGWLRRQVFWISKQILQLVMEDAIDDWLLRQINLLRREDVIAQGIWWLQDVLWPGGTFFMKIGTKEATVGADGDELKPSQIVNQHGNVKPSDTGSFEQQLEAARRASELKKLLFDGAPTTLVSLIGAKQYRRCARDIYYFSQSTVCLKQLAYAILELILASVFPELRSLIWDVHGKKLVHQPL